MRPSDWTMGPLEALLNPASVAYPFVPKAGSSRGGKRPTPAGAEPAGTLPPAQFDAPQPVVNTSRPSERSTSTGSVSARFAGPHRRARGPVRVDPVQDVARAEEAHAHQRRAAGLADRVEHRANAPEMVWVPPLPNEQSRSPMRQVRGRNRERECSAESRGQSSHFLLLRRYRIYRAPPSQATESLSGTHFRRDFGHAFREHGIARADSSITNGGPLLVSWWQMKHLVTCRKP